MKIYHIAQNSIKTGDWVRVTANLIRRQGIRKFSLLGMEGKVAGTGTNDGKILAFVLFPEFKNSPIRTGWPVEPQYLEIISAQHQEETEEINPSQWLENWNRGKVDSPSNWDYESFEGQNENI